MLSVLGALDRPLSHGELLARPELEGLDDVTLYRTLSSLAGARLVHRIVGLDGVWRYGAQPRGQAGCPGNHAHFLCTACGAMACLADQPLPRVDAPEGAEVEGRQLLAFGRCAACAGRR